MIDVTTAAGKVRLLCTDTDESDEIFSDAEIEAFLVVCDNAILLAAALALDTMASSEALVLKSMTLMDLQTSGPAVAAALRNHAANLRTQHMEQAGAMVDFIENPQDFFALREMIVKDAFRGLI